MRRLTGICILMLLISYNIGISSNYTCSNPDPSGTCGNTTYTTGTDVFGDIISSFPCPNPGPSNAWVGTTYAGGFVYQAKNIASGTLARIYKKDPVTGAVADSFNCPFTGYIMNITYDGTGGFWMAQWSPSNVIWHITMTGGIISSFVPATAPYSCRTTMWDGTNLWVGANAGSSNTKLYKMTTTGTILQEWLTGTVVGWYMGGSWNTQAPAGSEIFVVDNIGNTIDRLNVVGTSVTLNASIPATAASPDVAEGLGFDGEYLWHNGAYASQGLVWKLDDGVAGGGPPNVSVTLVPFVSPITIPATGGSFSFYAFVSNNESTSVQVSLWTMQILPDSSTMGPLMGPATVTLPPGVRGYFRVQNVPGTAMPGSYTYIGNVGLYPGTVYDSDSFPFTKSALDNGGSFVGEWSNSGQSFETVVTAAPVDYILHGASPNPFNPTTTLSFALPQAGQVKLSVFNVAGRQVAELVNGYRDAGTHEVTFDASNLSSGLYIYQLSSGDFNATGKMVLMK